MKNNEKKYKYTFYDIIENIPIIFNGDNLEEISIKIKHIKENHGTCYEC